MKKILGPAAALIVATASLALGAGPALASHVQCGDVLTHDTTLDANIVGCSGDGLVIGAPNLTIDLNGHRLWGTGSGHGIINLGAPAQTESCSHDACFPTAGFAGLTVKDGTIGGFAADVYAVGDDQVFRGLKVRGNLAACCFGQFDAKIPARTTLLNSTVDGDARLGRDGLAQGNRIGGVLGLKSGTVTRNTVGDAVAQGQMYRTHLGAGPVLISRNRIGGGVFVPASTGSGAEIDQNDIAGGIVAMHIDEAATLLSITANRVHASKVQDGIRITGNWCATVTGNWVYDNPTNGIYVSGGCANGAAPCTIVSNNRIYGNVLDGIFAMSPSADCAGGGRQITQNNVVRNGANGIEVGGGSAPVVLDRNAANRNGADGIKVASTNATITGNRAWWNGNLGIEALDGAQGSGNTARRNGNPAQCVPASLCVVP